MSISNGKLILGLITFMAYYFNGSSDPFPAHLCRDLNYCALARIDYYKKVFLLHFCSQVMGSAMADTSGKAATSFWKMSSLFSPPFEEGSSCVLSQTHLHWERSERCSPLCHQFQTVKPEFCKCSNYFKSRKRKEYSKVLVSLERGNASERFLSAVILLVCPYLSSLHLLFQIYSTSNFFYYVFSLPIFPLLAPDDIH